MDEDHDGSDDVGGCTDGTTPSGDGHPRPGGDGEGPSRDQTDGQGPSRDQTDGQGPPRDQTDGQGPPRDQTGVSQSGVETETEQPRERDWIRERFRRATWSRWFKLHMVLTLGLFGVGTLFGAAIGVFVPTAGQSDLPSGQIMPEGLTVGKLALNNLVVLVIDAAGLVTLGLATVGVLLLNGFILGLVFVPAAKTFGVPVALALIVPHGILELSAFFIVASIVFRLNHRALNSIFGRSDDSFTRQEAFEAAVLFLLSVLFILVAAWIEIQVTPEVGRLVDAAGRTG